LRWVHSRRNQGLRVTRRSPIFRRRPRRGRLFEFVNPMCVAVYAGLLNTIFCSRVPRWRLLDARIYWCHGGPDHRYEDRRQEHRREDGSQTRQHERPVQMGQPVHAITDKWLTVCLPPCQAAHGPDCECCVPPRHPYRSSQGSRPNEFNAAHSTLAVVSSRGPSYSFQLLSRHDRVCAR
jgi:hypothetical protein